MKRLALIVILILAASIASAQEATLNTPVAKPSEAKYKVEAFNVDATCACANVTVVVQDSGNADLRRQRYDIPDPAHPSATLVTFVTAIGAARSGETGGIARRMNFRVLGFLSDNGYLGGVVLVP